MGIIHNITIMDYIIFYNEASLQYYLYNGVVPINIMPYDRILWDDKVEVLDDALKNPRKKLFVHNKTRYIIVHRGKFLTHES